jgi:hypothetical protein
VSVLKLDGLSLLKVRLISLYIQVALAKSALHNSELFMCHFFLDALTSFIIRRRMYERMVLFSTT